VDEHGGVGVLAGSLYEVHSVEEPVGRLGLVVILRGVPEVGDAAIEE
jgi:hypothetical protein